MYTFNNHKEGSMSATCDRLLAMGIFEDYAASIIANDHGKTQSAALGKLRNHVSHLVKNGLAEVEKKAINGKRWLKASPISTHAGVTRIDNGTAKLTASPVPKVGSKTVEKPSNGGFRGTFRAMRGLDPVPAKVAEKTEKASLKAASVEPVKRSTFFNATRQANTIADRVLVGSVRFASLVDEICTATKISRAKAAEILKARLVSLGAKERAGFWYVTR